MLNTKQRDILANSIVKLAEYVVLTLVIGQFALKQFNWSTLLLSGIIVFFLYLCSIFLLRSVKEAI